MKNEKRINRRIRPHKPRYGKQGIKFKRRNFRKNASRQICRNAINLFDDIFILSINKAIQKVESLEVGPTIYSVDQNSVFIQANKILNNLNIDNVDDYDFDISSSRMFDLSVIKFLNKSSGIEWEISSDVAYSYAPIGADAGYSHYDTKLITDESIEEALNCDSGYIHLMIALWLYQKGFLEELGSEGCIEQMEENYEMSLEDCLDPANDQDLEYDKKCLTNLKTANRRWVDSLDKIIGVEIDIVGFANHLIDIVSDDDSIIEFANLLIKLDKLYNDIILIQDYISHDSLNRLVCYTGQENYIDNLDSLYKYLFEKEMPFISYSNVCLNVDDKINSDNIEKAKKFVSSGVDMDIPNRLSNIIINIVDNDKIIEAIKRIPSKGIKYSNVYGRFIRQKGNTKQCCKRWESFSFPTTIKEFYKKINKVE